MMSIIRSQVVLVGLTFYLQYQYYILCLYYLGITFYRWF